MKKLLFFGSILINIAIISVVEYVVFYERPVLPRSADVAFDSARWKAGSPDEWLCPQRTPMVNDLLLHVLNRGMSRSMVRELLGPSDGSRRNPAEIAGESYRIGHYLPTQRGSELPNDLVIQFDERDDVDDISIKLVWD